MANPARDSSCNASFSDLAADPELLVVLAGKSGAGKSTLINNFFGVKGIINISPDSTSERISSVSKSEYTNSGLKVNVVDTPGLKERKKDKLKQMKELAAYTNEKADLLIYCIPVNPSSKFQDNLVTIECFQQAFGKQIWKHCIPIFTFSNQAWEVIKTQDNGIQTPTEAYKGYIKTYAERFETELKRTLKLSDQRVTTIFDRPAKEDKNTMVAIPTGLTLKDSDLPGIGEENWKETILYEMERKCSEKGKPAIDVLKYRYKMEALKRAGKYAIGGGVPTAVVGGIAGAVVGGVIGIPGGPPGVAAGIAIGVVAGGTVAGTLAGGTGAVAGVGKTYVEKSKIKKKSDEQKVEGAQP